jgi:hypothetical protein
VLVAAISIDIANGMVSVRVLCNFLVEIVNLTFGVVDDLDILHLREWPFVGVVEYYDAIVFAAIPAN